eukprot:94956-Pelagomonas_calceolata.AAC.4
MGPLAPFLKWLLLEKGLKITLEKPNLMQWMIGNCGLVMKAKVHATVNRAHASRLTGSKVRCTTFLGTYAWKERKGKGYIAVPAYEGSLEAAGHGEPLQEACKNKGHDGPQLTTPLKLNCTNITRAGVEVC